jgi:alkylation response protein AidB-like acyl-CoA dehydrogenase
MSSLLPHERVMAAQWKMASACSWRQKGTAGLTITVLLTIDETRKLCEVRLDNISLPTDALLGDIHQGWSPLSRVIARATAALAAEMCDGAQQVLDMTVAYAKIRIAQGRLPTHCGRSLPFDGDDG